jgi:hypothetical protein
LNHIDKGTTVYTDGWSGYDNLAVQEYIHETVNHVEEYVRGQVHTQGIDNFWSLLRRGLTGTYVAVEPFHPDRYVGEQVFRYNNRLVSDVEQFTAVMKQIVGRRLTYDELIGKTERSSEMGPRGRGRGRDVASVSPLREGYEGTNLRFDARISALYRSHARSVVGS